jgi:XRE family transcriptional regulator of biofilm formation
VYVDSFIIEYNHNSSLRQDKGWDKMLIGDIIKTNRLEKKLSLTKLADQAGVSKAYLFNLENNNQKNPSLDIAQRIANVLEIDPFVLLSGTPVEKKISSAELPSFVSIFELQRQIEEMHPNKLEELKNFIEFIMWKKVKSKQEVKNRIRLID